MIFLLSIFLSLKLTFLKDLSDILMHIFLSALTVSSMEIRSYSIFDFKSANSFLISSEFRQSLIFRLDSSTGMYLQL